MVTSNHRPMSQPERSFWREAFLVGFAAYLNNHPTDATEAAVGYAVNKADAAVAAYRNRVTWRAV